MLRIFLNISTMILSARNYLIHIFEVFRKFCKVFLDYKCRYVVNRFNRDPISELNNVCNFSIDILNFVKVCVSVLL